MKLSTMALGIALGMLGTAGAHATSVVLSPSVVSNTVGASFGIDITVNALPSGEIVSVFDLNIYFDSAQLKATGFTLAPTLNNLGGPWDSSTSLFHNGTNPGMFDLFGYSLTMNDDDLAALQADGSVTLGTLQFEAIGVGLSNVYVGSGPNERDLVGRNAEFLQDVTFGTACVATNSSTGGSNACAIPEPSSYALAGIALAAAGLVPTLRRRRQGKGN